MDRLRLKQNKMEEFFAYTRERILERTLKHTSYIQCTSWTGPLKKGSEYSQLRSKDAGDGRLKTGGVHRVALMVSGKVRSLDVPVDQVTSHLCNNSLCVNTDHLFFFFFFFFLIQTVNNNRAVCISNNECYGHCNDVAGNARPPWC